MWNLFIIIETHTISGITQSETSIKICKFLDIQYWGYRSSLLQLLYVLFTNYVSFLNQIIVGFSSQKRFNIFSMCVIIQSPLFDGVQFPHAFDPFRQVGQFGRRYKALLESLFYIWHPFDKRPKMKINQPWTWTWNERLFYDTSNILWLSWLWPQGYYY